MGACYVWLAKSGSCLWAGGAADLLQKWTPQQHVLVVVVVQPHTYRKRERVRGRPSQLPGWLGLLEVQQQYNHQHQQGLRSFAETLVDGF